MEVERKMNRLWTKRFDALEKVLLAEKKKLNEKGKSGGKFR